MSKCCFCGKEVDYKINGNDPRPIKIADEENPVCCNECNARIVIPTRQSVWHFETENFFLKEKLSLAQREVCDAVYKLTRELMSFGYDTVKLKDVEKVLEQFDRGE